MRLTFFGSVKELGGGSVINSGIYAIQFCQFIFKEEPQSIKATGTLNNDGVDIETSFELTYGDNRIAQIKTSALKVLSNTAKIIGTNGELTVNKST